MIRDVRGFKTKKIELLNTLCIGRPRPNVSLISISFPLNVNGVMQYRVNDAVYHILSEDAAERCISICFLT